MSVAHPAPAAPIPLAQATSGNHVDRLLGVARTYLREAFASERALLDVQLRERHAEVIQSFENHLWHSLQGNSAAADMEPPPLGDQTVAAERCFETSPPGANHTLDRAWLFETLDEHERHSRAGIKDVLAQLNSISATIEERKAESNATRLEDVRVFCEQAPSGDEKSQHPVRKSNRHRAAFSSERELGEEDKMEVQNVVKEVRNKSKVSENSNLETSADQRDISRKLWEVSDDTYSKLDLGIAVIVLTNAVVMTIELQWQGHRSRLALGLQESSDRWHHAEEIFKYIDHLFNGLYIIEMIVRFSKQKCRYFLEMPNVLDFLLVATSSVQLYILEPLNVGSSGKLTLFRLLRFARFVRLLKVMRMPMFSELRVLVFTCFSSIGALMWSMVLLFLIMMLAGLFLCHVLRPVIQDEKQELELRQWLYRHYGDPKRSMYTIFEATLAGCWPNYFRPLLEKVNAWYSLFAVAYITLVVFAVIRIITAIFLKKTLQVAGNDAEMMINEQRARTRKMVDKLGNVFRALDASGDGKLCFEEFEIIVSNPDVRTWLQVLELEVHDVQGLFLLLDDGDGSLTYQEFLQGIMRLKGQARSLDVVALNRHCDKIEHALTLVLEFLCHPSAADWENGHRNRALTSHFADDHNDCENSRAAAGITESASADSTFSAAC